MVFFLVTMPAGQFDLLLPCSWFSCLTESDPWPADKRKDKNRFNKTRVKHFPKWNVDISAGQLNVLMSRSVINNKWEQLRCSPPQLYQPWNGRFLRRVWTCSGWAGPPLRRVWDAWWDRTRLPAANSYLTKENKKPKQADLVIKIFFPHKLAIS